jgi:hypothetical protein
MLWPALLAPFWAMGAKGEALLWPAWGLSFAAWGGLAVEAHHLATRLAGRTAAVGAAAMVLSFAGFAWCATSGMEVVPFAWAIARATRRAAEWAEVDGASGKAPTQTRARMIELVGLAWGAALLRPEGALTALFVAAALAFSSHRPSLRFAAIPAAAAAGATPALLWLLTGSARSTTAIAKLLLGNPYYASSALEAKVFEQARLLVSTLLNGEIWSAEFLPRGGSVIALAGLGAVCLLGARTRTPWRAAGVLLLALSMFAPCFYVTFLWNRLRYLWPFATGWLVGLSCLARVVSDLVALASRRARGATGLVCGLFAGMLASKVEWALDDVAQSASGIDRQQVALGIWARANLPATARIGVNDTGAIAYFGGHPTFDVVGLTTRDEARYWVAGVGSRFEHYERLHAQRPSALPTHFIVYPEWMGIAAILGEPLHEAVVTDSTILGGQTMRAYVADWSKLESGTTPWSSSAPILDAIDVADLESESDHEYELLGARDGEQTVYEGSSPQDRTVVDGGRTGRARERFVAHLPPGRSARAIVRLRADAASRVHVIVNGTPAGDLNVDSDEGDWTETTFDLPSNATGPRTRIEIRVEGPPLTVFHYWFVAPT